MIDGRRRRRGAPLVAMVLVVGGWVAMRLAVLEGAETVRRDIADTVDPISEAEAEVLAVPLRRAVPEDGIGLSPPLVPRRQTPAGVTGANRATIERQWPAPLPAIPVDGAPSGTVPVRLAEAAQPFQVLPRPAAPPSTDKRWSADAWLLIRHDGNGARALLARYGASQAGAVLRYRLAPDTGHRPAAYLRAAAALDRPRQEEVALGVSARAWPGLPVVAAAELRVTSDSFATRLRPAVLAYTELPPFDLSPHVRGEVYLQGGYVGGKGGTAFVDGQVRVDRALADLGRAELRLGAGAWGGAQDGAARLDVGPAAQVAFPLAKDVFGRLAFDWRFRVAGDAAPASGPALTLSAGF